MALMVVWRTNYGVLRDKISLQPDDFQQSQVIDKFLVLSSSSCMAGFGGSLIKSRLRTSYSCRESGRDRAGVTCMVNLENKEEDNEEGTLGSSTRHAAVTGHSTMISDGQSPVREVGDDESEGTCWNVKIREDCDYLVM